MIFFLRQFIIILSISILLVNQTFSKNQERFSRNFWNPTFNREFLNYCSLDGKECGLSVANRYCKLLGYENAEEAVIAYNVGVTHYLETRARCKGWSCTGFTLITCTGHFHHHPLHKYYYRLQRFAFPRFGHYRVDWCYENGQGCGQKAAYSFCRRLGYSRAKEFTQEEHVAATKAIGNQKLCFGKMCKAFSSITCYR